LARLTLFLILISGPLWALQADLALRAWQPVASWQPGSAERPVMKLTLAGESLEVELEDNRALTTNLALDRKRAIAAAGDRFLRGRIAEHPGTWARLNWIDGRLSGAVFDGEELWLIDQAADLGVTVLDNPRQSVAYRFSDLKLDFLFDHGGIDAPEARSAGAFGASYTDFAGHLREIVALEGTAMMAVPITVVSDVEFNLRHGDNSDAVVLGRVNFIDGIFSSQVGVGITLLHHEMLSDNGPLTSTDSGVLLSDQFGPFMRTGDGSLLPFGGLGHLFTNRDLDGGTVGIAYIGSLCDPGFGHGITQDLTTETGSSLVLAHEVGHNFGARHDNNPEFCPDGTPAGIMNSSINGSQDFSQCSLDAMAPRVEAAFCLVEASDEIFSDGFEIAP